MKRREVQSRFRIVQTEDDAMSDKRDYYEVLGVEKSASPSELKNSFRRLARKYHPDRSTEADAEDRFKEIQEAYAVLSDEQKRAQYDRFGHDGPQVPRLADLVEGVSTSTSKTSSEGISSPLFSGGVPVVEPLVEDPIFFCAIRSHWKTSTLAANRKRWSTSP